MRGKPTATEITQTGYSAKTSSDRSIDLCILRDAVCLVRTWLSYVDATVTDNRYAVDRQESSADCY